MTENGSQKRPVRTLEIKHFSVIHKARLEFGRITVLIGPQASGKSLLCRLAYFLGGEIPGIAVDSLLHKISWEEFLRTLEREFRSRFSTSGWLRISSEASFSSEKYSVCIRGAGNPLNPNIEFSFGEEFKRLYEAIAHNPSKQPSPVTPSAELQQDLWLEFSLLMNRRRAQASHYIPSERSIFLDQGMASSVLQNPDLDQITKQFATRVPRRPNWKVGLLTTGRGVLQNLEKEFYRLAGGAVAVVDGQPIFIARDGRELPLSLLSSGTSDLLPMFALFDYLAFYQEHFHARAATAKMSPLADLSEYSPLVYLEEPEAGVFPETQRDLVNLFAWMTNDPILSFDWVFTTHSPYILTAFNTLIEAWRAGRKPGKHDRVSAIIPEHSWVSEDDFAAYTIHKGILRPIFAKETTGIEGSGLIDGDYLDSVSDQLGGEFDRLLDIEYAE